MPDKTCAEMPLLHGRLRMHKRRVHRARRIIEQALVEMQSPSVAFSGGKDSTVVLHLVRSIAPDTPAHYGHEEWVLPETAALIEATPNVVKTALPDRHAEWFAVQATPSPLMPDTML